MAEGRDPHRLGLSPRSVKSYLAMGHLYVYKKDFASAEVFYRKARDVDRRSVEALIALGNYYRLVDRLEEAEQAYREARRLRPAQVDLHILLGDLHTLSGKRAEGVKDYLEALRLNPGLSQARLALSHYEDSIRLDREHSVILTDVTDGSPVGRIGFGRTRRHPGCFGVSSRRNRSCEGVSV